VPVSILSADVSSAATETPAIERDHVQRVYDAVATEWHGTRYKAWPRVVEFIQSIEARSLVADLGCGNGKLAPACKEMGHYAIGCDFSISLIRIAALQMGMESQAADALVLPYRSGMFDAAVSIAVLHHISTPERRRILISETLRVLRPGGQALFYAWAADQSEGRSSHNFDVGSDVFVPFHSRLKPTPKPTTQAAGSAGKKKAAAHEPESASSTAAASGKMQPGTEAPASSAAAPAAVTSSATNAGSTEVAELEAYGGVFDETKRAVVFQRYCHVYQQGELRELVTSVGDVCVIDEYYDTGNHCILVRKAQVSMTTDHTQNS